MTVRTVNPAGEGTRPAPRHIAIIMDGNGRWAAARGLPRVEGHRRGMEAIRRTVRAGIELGVGTMTFFSFLVRELAAAGAGGQRT